MAKKTILHMDLDTFYVSIERLLNSELKDKPLLVGGTGDRGIVAACSYETRGYGIHSGMSMKLARQLCPEAKVIRGNAATYTHYSSMVTEILKEALPIVEKSSIDEFYADLTGMDRFFGCYHFATELRERIMNETGLPLSFGLSLNKVVSKVATNEAKPNSHRYIEHGTEKSFLAPLSVKKIPMVGDKTYITLRNLGIRFVRTIHEMPIDVFEHVFGAQGTLIWKRAHGIDNSPIIPYSERKSISTERTFEKDTTHVEQLSSIIAAMTENLAYQLRRGEKLTACIAVKIKYSDFNTYSKQVKIPYTNADHILIPKVKELFRKLYTKRLLIRLVGVRFSHLVNGNHQMNLFEDTQEIFDLYRAMDTIRIRYGDRSILRASGLGAKTIGRITNPFNGEPPTVLAHRKQ